MSNVITLDLNEVADDWQEVLNEQGANVPNTEGMSWGEVAEATERFLAEPEQQEMVQQYVDLCGELGISPAEPDTLRWYARDHTLIREDTFEEYAREYAEDIFGDSARELASYIDWGKFARSIQQDYRDITYDDHEWLERA